MVRAPFAKITGLLQVRVLPVPLGTNQRKDNDMSAIDKVRLFLACLAIANQEAHEVPQDDGPVQVGIVGGEVMELGPQVGGDIPF